MYSGKFGRNWISNEHFRQVFGKDYIFSPGYRMDRSSLFGIPVRRLRSGKILCAELVSHFPIPVWQLKLIASFLSPLTKFYHLFLYQHHHFELGRYVNYFREREGVEWVYFGDSELKYKVFTPKLQISQVLRVANPYLRSVFSFNRYRWSIWSSPFMFGTC